MRKPQLGDSSSDVEERTGVLMGEGWKEGGWLKGASSQRWLAIEVAGGTRGASAVGIITTN